mgnify:CR=1 FL=1
MEHRIAQEVLCVIKDNAEQDVQMQRLVPLVAVISVAIAKHASITESAAVTAACATGVRIVALHQIVRVDFNVTTVTVFDLSTRT